MSSFSSGLFFKVSSHWSTWDWSISGLFLLLFPICCRSLGPDGYFLLKANVFDVGFLEIHSMFETIQKDFGLQEYGSRKPENTLIIKHLWVYIKKKNLLSSRARDLKSEEHFQLLKNEGGNQFRKQRPETAV